MNNFKEFILLEYKFVNDTSSKCKFCSSSLKIVDITENHKHIYTIGQLYKCRCGISSIWTNSIRNEKALLNFIKGTNTQYPFHYYQGFCNDLFCGLCQSRIDVKKNGIEVPFGITRGDLFGCENEHCKNQGIIMFTENNDREGAESTQKLINFYKNNLEKWERFV